MVAVALVAIIGCQEKQAEVKVPALETQEQKQAYALGASLGMYLQKNLEEQTRLEYPLEKDLMVQGFLAGVDGKSAIEQEEMETLLKAYGQTMQLKQQEKLDAEAQKNLDEGLAFLAENLKKEGVQVTESGLQYVVNVEGEGAKPVATDTVKVHYKGTFIDGTVFDSSIERGEPTVFPLNRVISGWTEGVQLMSVGAKYKFTIPSELAYGANGNPPRMPGNTVLEFEIELLEIQQPEVPAQVGEAAAE